MTKHPDGPDSPAALRAEAFDEAVARECAALREQLNDAHAVVAIAADRLRNAQRELLQLSGDIAIARDVLEDTTLGELRRKADRSAGEVERIADSLWTGECAIADLLQDEGGAA